MRADAAVPAGLDALFRTVDGIAALCGPDSDWVTGQTIAANGGWTMW